MNKITDECIERNAYVIHMDMFTALQSGYIDAGCDADTKTLEYNFLRDGDYSREQLILLYLSAEDKIEELKKRLN